MLTLSLNGLNRVYLWTKAMKKLTRNLVEEDSSLFENFTVVHS